MNLLEIGRDRWTVLVVADGSWESELLNVLRTPSETNLGARMLALLREYVPTNGPPRNKEISKDLGGGRFEFRRQPRKGAALRVLYFFDRGQVIVCSNAFWKKTNRTPSTELKRIDDTMAAYEAARRNGRLEIRLWKL
jgi:phage-related protein